MSLAAIVGIVFLAVMIGWLALVAWGTKHTIDLELDAERRH